MKKETAASSYKIRINNFLNSCMFASVASVYKDTPVNRMYIFASDSRGMIYIRTRPESSLCRNLESNPHLSLSIYRENSSLAGITSLTAEGTGHILDNTNSEEIQHAYSCLAKKSPLIGQTPFSPERDNYRIIRILPKEFRIRDYSEYLQDTPQKILRRG